MDDLVPVLVSLAALVVVLVGVWVYRARASHPQDALRGEQPSGPVQWVDPATLTPGPYRRESFTPEQQARIRQIHDTFGEIDGLSLEKRLDDFRRDANLERELEVWDRMIAAYHRYVDSRQLSPQQKLDVYRILILRSLAPAEEVVGHLQLDELTLADAQEVMRAF